MQWKRPYHCRIWHVIFFIAQASATLLAASKLEACVSTNNNEPLQGCTSKFVMSLSVQNGQNSTESVVTYKLQQAEGSDGKKYDVLDTVEMFLQKSIIQLSYPLRYERNYNNQPFEIMLTRDSSGRSFNWLTNPCVDDPNVNGACGYLVDGAGSRVPYSNGFCCRCDLADFLGGANSGSRAHLDCALFSSSNSQSAHCIRMSPLWYSAFSIGPPQVQYRVDVVFKHCTGGNQSHPTNCKFHIASIGPSSPGSCVSFSSSTVPGCDAWVSLEGDFAAFEDAPDYSSKYLMIPLICDDFAICGDRSLETPDRWMLTDRSLTTFGSDCDKIGVSYSGFQSQGSRCQMPVGSCLRYQLQNLYDADLQAEAAGRVGQYFVKNFKLGGDFYANVQSPTDPRMVFRTNRFQKSVITVMMNGDSIRYVQRVAPGKLLSIIAPPFEAMSADGVMSVYLQNIGDVQSLFTVTVHCQEGVLAIVAQQITLSPPPSPISVGMLQFRLQTSKTTAAAYLCLVRLQDGLYKVTDSQVVSLNVTALVQNVGEQGGSPLPGAATTSDPMPVPKSCSNCKPWDAVCLVQNRCFSIIGSWVGGLLGAAGVIGLLLKFPSLACLPFQLCCRLCSNCNSTNNGNTREKVVYVRDNPVANHRWAAAHHRDEVGRDRRPPSPSTPRSPIAALTPYFGSQFEKEFKRQYAAALAARAIKYGPEPSPVQYR